MIPVQNTRKTQVTHQDQGTGPVRQDQNCVLTICEPWRVLRAGIMELAAGMRRCGRRGGAAARRQGGAAG
jgi:hypothetical protein